MSCPCGTVHYRVEYLFCQTPQNRTIYFTIISEMSTLNEIFDLMIELSLMINHICHLVIARKDFNSPFPNEG